MDSDSVHVPVMPREVMHHLQLSEGLTVMDGTVGAGGHSRQILEQIGNTGQLVGFDRDPMMLAFARARLADTNTTFFHGSYTEAPEALEELGVVGVDRVLLDLGLSSDQLADRDRGFGFDAGGPLDMRFDVSRGQSAAEFLRSADQQTIASVLSDLGEERFAEQIAQEICTRRRLHPVETTKDLEDCVRAVVPAAAVRGGRNSATQVFQALRITVNDELEHVSRMMNSILPSILKPGGIAVVLTFHSLEDRIVKSAFKGQQQWQALTKTPITATPAEIRLNPRSRSAKLRAARRKPT